MIVAKFGGSSLASAEEMATAAMRLREINRTEAIVVSAGGARGREPKITDMLIAAYGEISRGKDLRKSLMPFIGRAADVTEKLKLNIDCMKILGEIERGFACQPTLDFLISRGEAVWSALFAAYVGYARAEAADVMRFGTEGAFDSELSELLIRELYREKGRFVIGGFYGADADGRIKTFSRGGSDYTGAVVARALRADVYYNFTDVDGFYDSDPKRNPSASVLPEISFDNARRLGEFGAGVLHPDSVLPLVGTGISVRVENTFRKAIGTTVKEECKSDCRAAAFLPDCFFVRLRTPGKGRTFLKKCAEISGKRADFYSFSFLEDEAEFIGKARGAGAADLFSDFGASGAEIISPVRLLFVPSRELGVKISHFIEKNNVCVLSERLGKHGLTVCVAEDNADAAEKACYQILSGNGFSE